MRLSKEAKAMLKTLLKEGVGRRTAYRKCKERFGNARLDEPEFKYEFSTGRWV